jgi:hypothetical protein
MPSGSAANSNEVLTAQINGIVPQKNLHKSGDGKPVRIELNGVVTNAARLAWAYMFQVPSTSKEGVTLNAEVRVTGKCYATNVFINFGHEQAVQLADGISFRASATK